MFKVCVKTAIVVFVGIYAGVVTARVFDEVFE